MAGTNRAYKQDNDAQQWVERYVAEVGRMLPARQRGDIEMEIRSLILDEVEAEAPQGASEAAVLAVLQRYPKPAQMAQRYGATQHLIGPALYPNYIQVLRLVLAIVTVVMVVGSLLGIFVGIDEFSILGLVGGIISNLFIAAAIVTLIFALIERSDDAQHTVAEAGEEATWNPKELPRVEDRDRVSLGDMLGNIITTLVGVLWLTLYVGDDGTMAIYVNGPVRLSVFSAEFVRFIPWIALLWVGEIILYIVALARSRWERRTRFAIALFHLAGVVLLSIMLTATPLAASAMLEPVVRVGVGIMLLITLWELASQVWALFRNAAGAQGNRFSTTSAL